MRTNTRTIVFAVLLCTLFLLLVALMAIVPPPLEREFVSRSGYALSYPNHWIVLEAGKGGSFASAVIREPRGRATISIATREEARLKDRGGRVAVASEIEAGFSRDGEYQLDFFRWHNADIGAEDNGYIAAGSFVYDSVHFDFKEIGVLDPSGTVTVFRTEVISAFTLELGPMLDASLWSIENKKASRPLYEPLSSEQALNRVRGLPSVILYGAEGLQEGSDFALEATDEGEAWSVRMFVTLGGESAKEIPVQMWRVDKAMGVISKTVL